MGFEQCQTQSRALRCLFAVSARDESPQHSFFQVKTCSFREPNPPHGLREDNPPPSWEGLCGGGDLPLGEPHGKGESRVTHSPDRDTLSRPETTRFATYGSVYGPCRWRRALEPSFSIQEAQTTTAVSKGPWCTHLFAAQECEACLDWFSFLSLL